LEIRDKDTSHEKKKGNVVLFFAGEGKEEIEDTDDNIASNWVQITAQQSKETEREREKKAE
jgi:hypothetical protein